MKKVPKSFQEKYCDECSLKLCCDRFYNPHCAKTVGQHELAVMEIIDIIKE